MKRISSSLLALMFSCLVCGSVVASNTKAVTSEKVDPYERFSEMSSDASQDGLSKPDVAVLCTVTRINNKQMPNARLIHIAFNNKKNVFSFRASLSSFLVKQLKENANVALIFNFVTPKFPYRQVVVYGKASIIPSSIQSIPGGVDKQVSYQVLSTKIKFTDGVDTSMAKSKGAEAIHLEDYTFNENGESTKVRDKVFYYQ